MIDPKTFFNINKDPDQRILPLSPMLDRRNLLRKITWRKPRPVSLQLVGSTAYQSLLVTVLEGDKPMQLHMRSRRSDTMVPSTKW